MKRTFIATDDQQIEKLRRLVGEYVLASPNAKWLNLIDWQLIPVKMQEKMPTDVLGMYSMGYIVIMHSLSAHSIFPTFVHELRHRWQWKTNPIKYLIGKLYRPLIERDAVAQEDQARAWITTPENCEKYHNLD